ncbi:hypothetical protein DVH24_021046 [Malus domestica]|uniref:Uncharacterized protein n=1 Tax=Malus domestica TaxID=3750 RepID=A0A498JDX2_MALDO|nr:hypothetical protein DVH24_021046 [Malus domestica]
MAIEVMSPLEKFSQSQFKSFRYYSNPDYEIMHYQNAIALYNNDGPTMRWYSELPNRSIDWFESLANIFTNTYFVYLNVHKRHEAMFTMAHSY